MTTKRPFRRLALAAAAALACGALGAGPAAAEQNFGAGNLPGMEITEGGTLDYAVSFQRCPDGYECMLHVRSVSGKAVKRTNISPSGKVTTDPAGDFDSPTQWRVHRPQDGSMVEVLRIRTFDDAVNEGDEPFFVEARVDYYKGGCAQGIGRSPSCVPESSMTWLAIITIEDNDSRFAKRYVAKGLLYTDVKGKPARRLGRARARRIARTFAVPYDHSASTQAAHAQPAPAPEQPKAQEQPAQEQPAEPAPSGRPPQEPRAEPSPDSSPQPSEESSPSPSEQAPPSGSGGEGTTDYGGCACSSGSPSDPR